VALTTEDRQRGRMYRQQACRDEYLEQARPTSLEEFYASLNLVVSIEPVKAQSVARVAQLTQRTNQFNFTTRRYSANDIEAMIANPDYQLHTLRVRDRFGELGIVGATIVHAKNGTWMLDSFLMSCRALGRGVEDALFASVARRAHAEGASVVGQFVPTRRNAPAREFLAKHRVAPPPDWNGDLWEFSVPRELEQPRWITQAAVGNGE
jgi:FkbH-like protein